MAPLVMSEQWVLKILGDVSSGMFEEPMWLVYYDPSGEVTIRLTPDVAHAKRFPGMLEALQCWKTVKPDDPVRWDGKPNRPLTIFHVSPEKVDE